MPHPWFLVALIQQFICMVYIEMITFECGQQKLVNALLLSIVEIHWKVMDVRPFEYFISFFYGNLIFFSSQSSKQSIADGLSRNAMRILVQPDWFGIRNSSYCC